MSMIAYARAWCDVAETAAGMDEEKPKKRIKLSADWRPRAAGTLALKAAAGHRRRVVLLKVVLPATALGLLIMVLAWPSFNGNRGEFRLDYASEKEELAATDEMINPRFVGVDVNDQPFSVTAETAMRAGDASNHVFLVMPEADITLKDGQWMTVRSDHGVYDPSAQTISLSGGVSLYTDRGFEMHTEAATLDLRTGVAQGFDPLHGQGQWGLLDAIGFQYRRAESAFLFEGRPTLVLYPQSTGG